MTEDEAKTKKCCNGMLVSELGVGGVITSVSSNCIASNCMAWKHDQTAITDADRQGQGCDPFRELRGPRGYCGLAK